MKALRIVGPGSAEVATVPDPVPAAGEVVVEVAMAAICNTDLKMVRRGQPQGRVLGHEAAGYLADGTPVGIHPDVGCGECDRCRTGETIRCPYRNAVGIDRDGGLADRVVVPASHAVPLVGVPFELAPLAEPLACCVHAATSLGEPVQGTAVVVVGAGAMGIMMTWTLQALGLRVAVCETSETRRAQAAELGADAVFGPEEPPEAHLAATPAAVVVTAPGAGPLTWGLVKVAEGGTVHAFASTPGGAAVDANLVHYRHLRLVGSTGSSLTHYRRALDLIRVGAVDIGRLPRITTDLDGAVAAVTADQMPEHLRTVVDMKR